MAYGVIYHSPVVRQSWAMLGSSLVAIAAAVTAFVAVGRALAVDGITATQ